MSFFCIIKSTTTIQVHLEEFGIKMDWVHCNHCYIQPGDVEMKKFFITNCGHIYCDECLELNQSNECRICHIKYTTIPLTANMNSEVEVYFHDPVLNLKKQVKILEFQQSHRIRLVSHNRDRIRSYKALKKENYTLAEELKLCKKENASLREDIKRMKTDFQEFRKKCELMVNGDQPLKASPRTPQMSSFSQLLSKDAQKRTPILASKNVYRNNGTPGETNFNLTSRRPQNSNFFLMSESQPLGKDRKCFTTPDLPRFPGTYRTQKTLTPDVNTPPTPESIIREYIQKDPLQRKVKLPGSKGGPSPSSRIGFHGLTLSRPTSTPNKENTSTNKYLKYFK